MSNQPHFPRHTAKLSLQGPAGALEAMTTWPDQEPQMVAIICHPHPLYQGTMNNKVVTILAKTLIQMGAATVRFNYRGVGASEGSYGEMEGEVADLEAVKTWVNTELPGVKICLAGFSFGAYIAARVANSSDDVVQLISVAPAVQHADFTALTQMDCPWLVIQGEKDEIVPFERIVQFVNSSPRQPKLVTLPDATHFFHGHLLELADAIENHSQLA